MSMTGVIQNMRVITGLEDAVIDVSSAESISASLDALDLDITHINIPELIDDIMSHIRAGDSAHKIKRIEDPNKLTKTLYVQWLDKFPNDTYEEFLHGVTGIIKYHLLTVPDNLSNEKKSTYAFTLASLLYAYNKHHNKRPIEDIHGGKFIPLITDLLSVLDSNRTSIDTMLRYVSYINTDTVDTNNIFHREDVTYRDPYESPTVDMIQNTNNEFYGIVSPNKILESVITNYSELKIVPQTINMLSVIEHTSYPYYKPVPIDNFIDIDNEGLYIRFKFKESKETTGILTYRDRYGRYLLGIMYDHISQGIYLRYISNGILKKSLLKSMNNATEYMINKLYMTVSNNMVDVTISTQGGRYNISQEVDIDSLNIDYVDIGLKILSDVYKANIITDIRTLDIHEYPDAVDRLI